MSTAYLMLNIDYKYFELESFTAGWLFVINVTHYYEILNIFLSCLNQTIVILDFHLVVIVYKQEMHMAHEIQVTVHFTKIWKSL